MCKIGRSVKRAVVGFTFADATFRKRRMIESSTYLALLLSPFLTPASGKIHMATTMKTAVIMM